MTVELPILGLLSGRPMHGYELRQALEKIVGHFSAVSWGSLYPMLKKLEERGYLTRTSELPDKGPERIVYQITPAGQERLIELLTGDDEGAEPIRSNDFLIKVAFFHVLPPEQRLGLLESHASRVEGRLVALQAEQERLGERTNRYRRALLDYALARLRTDLEWVATLIQQEHDGR